MSQKWLVQVELAGSPQYLVLRQGGENVPFLPYTGSSTPKKLLTLLIDEMMRHEMQNHILSAPDASPDDWIEKTVSLHATACVYEKCILKPLFQGYRVMSVTAREITHSPFISTYLIPPHSERLKLLDEIPHIIAVLPPRRTANDYFVVIADEDIEDELRDAGLFYKKTSADDL